MRILFAGGIVLVMEADFVGEFLNSRFAPGEKVPAIGSLSTPITLQVARFLLSGQSRRLARINADEYNLELFAGRGLNILQCFNEAVEDNAAHHRTAIIAEH